MASLLSPGVLTREIDLTNAAPAGASTSAGIAMEASWGPVDEMLLISDESSLVESFGKPSERNYKSWFTAKNFLSYSNSMYVIRSVGSNPLNSGIQEDGVLIKNSDDVDSHSGDELVCAKYPGVLGDSLKFWMVDSSSLSGSVYESEFPNSTVSGLDLDEVHVLVIDEDGLFTGVRGTILEKYEFLSKTSDAKNRDGSSNYYKSVINQNSDYIWVLNDICEDWGKTFNEVLKENENGSLELVAADASKWDLSQDSVFGTTQFNGEINESLSKGSDGLAATNADILLSFDKFKDDELVDVSFLLCADGGKVVADGLLEIAYSRKDCIVVVSPDYSDVKDDNPLDAIKTFRYNLNLGGLKDLKSSYVVMDDNWKYQFDKYNNVNRWVPCNGDTAGLMAETDNEKAVWASPGGRSLQNVIKLAWKSNKSDRDVLYPLGVNSITTFPGEGALLFGDKTLLQRPSAFDRINVRRLFIYLRKIISRTSRSFLFEQNTEYTRTSFINIVEPILEEIKTRGGITDFRVVCDSSNNT